MNFQINIYQLILIVPILISFVSGITKEMQKEQPVLRRNIGLFIEILFFFSFLFVIYKCNDHAI